MGRDLISDTQPRSPGFLLLPSPFLRHSLSVKGCLSFTRGHVAIVLWGREPHALCPSDSPEFDTRGLSSSYTGGCCCALSAEC